MKYRGIVVLAAPLCWALAGGLPARAAPPHATAGGTVRVTWVQPERVSPAQRVMLDRLLAGAVEGPMSRGSLVTDSSPRLDLQGMSHLSWTEGKHLPAKR